MSETQEPVKLENWSLCDSKNYSPYDPPELRRKSLQGNVYGHPQFNDGDHVVTSTVKTVNGRIVSTQTRAYVLGTPSPDYLKWLEENYPDKLPLNADEPIQLFIL